MEWSNLPWSPPQRQLRHFAALCLLIVSGPALWHVCWPDAGGFATAIAAGSIVIGGVGLVAPFAIRPVWVASLVVTFPVGWTISRVLLLILYFGLLTPLGLLMGWWGHDPLALRNVERSRATYWNERKAAASSAQYLRTY